MSLFLISGQVHADNLFSTAGAEGLSYDKPAEPYIKRSRPVTLNLGALNAAKPGGNMTEESSAGTGPAAPTGKELQLNLFPDVDLPVTFSDLHGNGSGSMTWTGKVEGNTDSLILLVVKDGVMTGNITVGKAQYQIRYIGGGLHEVNEIDQSGYPSEADPDRVEYPQTIPPADMPDTSRDDPASLDTTVMDGRETKRVIDVLVVYTAAARIAQGGTTAIRNLIDLAVTETNTGYTHSGINQELNLVHTAEISYTESGDIGLDRDRLRAPSDGFMDTVHTLRDAYDADLVSLIVDNGGGYCGIAYIMDPVNTLFQDSAFCVVADECATGYYSFGHELGHIMGARHDWYVDPTDNSPYTYNHALTNPTDSWRTIMAYNNACAAVGGSCTRLLYWSNPDNTYGGDPMGTYEGEVEPKDNRKTLANTGFVVANFRVKDTSATPSEEFDSGAVPSTNIYNGGPMFNLTAKKTTTIHGFATVFATAGTLPRIEIYYREGSYDGFITDPSEWILAGSANNVATNAAPAQTHIPIDLDITIPAGSTYSFYIVSTGSAGTEFNINYLAGTSEGAVYASDSSLQLMQGRGVRYPFTASWTPRVFSGTIYHSFSKGLKSLATPLPNNSQDGIMFDIRTKKKVTIRGFSTFVETDLSPGMEIWYRPGTHVGHETTQSDWTLLGTVDNVVGSNIGTTYIQNRIPIETDVTIPAGSTYGFYITATNNPNIQYRNGVSVGSVSASDGAIEVLDGVGKDYPFGTNYTTRAFAGTVYYSTPFPWPMALPAIFNNK